MNGDGLAARSTATSPAPDTVNPSSRKPRIRGRRPACVINRAGSTLAPAVAVGAGVTVCGPAGGGGG